jgi:hypothetical protein
MAVTNLNIPVYPITLKKTAGHQAITAKNQVITLDQKALHG